MFDRHLKTKHPTTYAAYEASKRKCSDQQQTLVSFISNTSHEHYSTSNPRYKMLCRSLVENVIIKGGIPISFVDNEGFRKFLRDIDPNFVAPCRQTVTYTHLPQLMTTKRQIMTDVLASSKDVALTIDIWTDRRQHSFLGVTAHIFDAARGQPQSLLLKFKSFRGSHTGQSIAQAIEVCISDNSLQSKVHHVVSDNASNMKKALSFVFASGPRGTMDSWLLSDCNNSTDINLSTEDDDSLVDDPSLFENLPDDEIDNSIIGERVPCFAHTLQLVIRDGLQKVTVSRSAVPKSCKIANLTHQSAKFRQAFEMAFGSGRAVPSSNDTRWNSVFHQLNYIIELDVTKLNELLRSEEHSSLIFTLKELQQLRELVTVLQPFAEATDIAQGSTYVTISCVVPLLLSLLEGLREQLASSKYQQPLVRELTRNLFTRFRGIFDQLHISCPKFIPSTDMTGSKDMKFDSNIYLMAASLDPEHGYRWLERHPGSVADKEALKTKILGMFITNVTH